MADLDFTTPEGRTCFLKVHTPERNEMNGNMEYSVVFLFPKSNDMSWLQKKWDECLMKQFKTKTPKGMRPLFNSDGMSDFAMIYDGDYKYQEADAEKKPMYEAFRGHWTITLRRKEFESSGVPEFFVLGEDCARVLNPNDFQSGDYAFSSMRLSAFESKKNKKNVISAKLLGIRKVRDGERFSGGGTMSEETALGLLGVDPTSVDSL